MKYIFISWILLFGNLIATSQEVSCDSVKVHFLNEEITEIDSLCLLNKNEILDTLIHYKKKSIYNLYQWDFLQKKIGEANSINYDIGSKYLKGKYPLNEIEPYKVLEYLSTGFPKSINDYLDGPQILEINSIREKYRVFLQYGKGGLEVKKSMNQFFKTDITLPQKGINLDWLNILIGALNLILLLFIWLRIPKISSMKNNINKMVEKNINEKFIEMFDELSEKFDTKTEELRNLITSLSEKVNDLKKELEASKTTNVKSNSDVEKRSLTEIMDMSNKEIVFAKEVNDGYFGQTKKKHSSTSLYFELAFDGKTGTYRITEDSETHKLVASDGWSTVHEAVEPMNSKNEFRNRINTIEFGLIEKTEKGWKIITKTKIRFE